MYTELGVCCPSASCGRCSLYSARKRSKAEGQELWHGTKYDQAVGRFQSALAADPDFVMANAALGGAYYSFVYNRSAEGQKYYEKALANSSRVTEREREIILARYAEDLDHVPDAIQLFEHYL